MDSHEPFEHLKHKLWQKERPRGKLAIWLPTTKSLKSTRPRCVHVECGTSLESSQRKLQVCFRLHPNRRSGQRVMMLQSGGSPETKSHLDVGAVERRREYYMGEGGGFSWVWAVVSLVSLELPVACPSTKVLQNVN
jgi:hypothetical protein